MAGKEARWFITDYSRLSKIEHIVLSPTHIHIALPNITTILDVCFLSHVPVLLLWHLPPVQSDIHQRNHLHPNETPSYQLRVHCATRGHVRS